jgi:RNA polymerase sigma-70 factor (ECF subfamily)
MTTEPEPSNPRDEIVTHLKSLRLYARSLTRNADKADDIVQDAIEKAWRNIDTFKVGSNMKAWLFTIVRNTFYSEMRKAGREVGLGEDDIALNRAAEKPRHDGVLQMRDFTKVFKELSPEHQEVIVLITLEGFTYEEVAEMCDTKVGTIKSRLFRARDILTDELDIDANEPLNMNDQESAAAFTHPPVIS